MSCNISISHLPKNVFLLIFWLVIFCLTNSVWTPWGQFELDIFSWTFVNETFIYDKSNILQTSCQIKLWNFLLQLEMTKKSLNFLSESYIFRRHCVEKTKTNWLQISRLRWPQLNFLSLCSKIWSQCDPQKSIKPFSRNFQIKTAEFS